MNDTNYFFNYKIKQKFLFMSFCLAIPLSSFADSKLSIDLSNLFPQSNNIQNSIIPDNKFFVKQCSIKPTIKTSVTSNKLQYIKRPFLDTHWRYDSQNNHPYSEFLGYFDVKYDNASLVSKTNAPYFCYALKSININIIFNPIIFETEELFSRKSNTSPDNLQDTPEFSCITSVLRQREQEPFLLYINAINNNLDYLSQLSKNFEKNSLPLFSTSNKEAEYMQAINNQLKNLSLTFQNKINADVSLKMDEFISKKRNHQSFKSCEKELSAFNIYNQSFMNFKNTRNTKIMENNKKSQEIFVIKDSKNSPSIKSPPQESSQPLDKNSNQSLNVFK